MNAQQREGARHAALRSANVALQHAGLVRYSEGSDRWSGITEQKRSWHGQYPPAADCSAFYTWCLWDATRWIDWPDLVNGTNWTGGFTGTLIEHGERIDAPGLAADAVIYGPSLSSTEHVTFYIGGGRVISHGSQGGPRLETYDYRPDILGYWRYIL